MAGTDLIVYAAMTTLAVLYLIPLGFMAYAVIFTLLTPHRLYTGLMLLSCIAVIGLCILTAYEFTHGRYVTMGLAGIATLGAFGLIGFASSRRAKYEPPPPERRAKVDRFIALCLICLLSGFLISAWYTS